MKLIERIKIAQRGRSREVFEDLCGLQRCDIDRIYNGKLPAPHIVLAIARESGVTMKNFLIDVTEPLWDEPLKSNKK